MSSIRLLVLGVVRIFQPIHGYDVRRELISWRAEDWGNVAPGSIYNAIKTLTREGFLCVSGTGQVGARPERTSYELTPAGEREHMRLLRETWREVRLPADPLMPALSFMTMLPRAELISYLRDRLVFLERMMKDLRWAQEHLVASAEKTARYTQSKRALPRQADGRLKLDDDFKPEHVQEAFELMLARSAGEAAWSLEFIARLEAGRYCLADDATSRWRSAGDGPERAEARGEARPPKAAGAATGKAAKAPKAAGKAAGTARKRPGAKKPAKTRSARKPGAKAAKASRPTRAGTRATRAAR